MADLPSNRLLTLTSSIHSNPLSTTTALDFHASNCRRSLTEHSFFLSFYCLISISPSPEFSVILNPPGLSTPTAGISNPSRAHPLLSFPPWRPNTFYQPLTLKLKGYRNTGYWDYTFALMVVRKHIIHIILNGFEPYMSGLQRQRLRRRRRRRRRRESFQSSRPWGMPLV